MADAPVAPATSLGGDTKTLFGAKTVRLPNALVHSNYADSSDVAWRRVLLSSQGPREAAMGPISLVRYPRGTLLDGHTYHVLVDDLFVAEQVLPWADLTGAAARMRGGGGTTSP